MMEQFKTHRFSASSRVLIDQVNKILAKHMKQGYSLTLRQLFYQCVSAGYIENIGNEYKRLGVLLSDARLAGEIDWNAVEDRTRLLRQVPAYASPAAFLGAVMPTYTEDLWANQPNYCEVWIEKDGLIGTVERSCSLYRVPFFACHGYVSQAALYEAGHRLRRKVDDGKNVTILYMGDFDAQGIDMTRDIKNRIDLFSRSTAVNVTRIALSHEQVAELRVPRDPSDAFAAQAYELDAVSPAELNRIMVSSIVTLLDGWMIGKDEATEALNRSSLKEVSF